jgi:hypothetical protein
MEIGNGHFRGTIYIIFKGENREYLNHFFLG